MTPAFVLFTALLGGFVGGLIGGLIGVCVAASFDRQDREPVPDRIDRPRMEFVPAQMFPVGPVTMEVYP